MTLTMPLSLDQRYVLEPAHRVLENPTHSNIIYRFQDVQNVTSSNFEVRITPLPSRFTFIQSHPHPPPSHRAKAASATC